MVRLRGYETTVATYHSRATLSFHELRQHHRLKLQTTTIHTTKSFFNPHHQSTTQNFDHHLITEGVIHSFHHIHHIHTSCPTDRQCSSLRRTSQKRLTNNFQRQRNLPRYVHALQFEIFANQYRAIFKVRLRSSLPSKNKPDK